MGEIIVRRHAHPAIVHTKHGTKRTMRKGSTFLTKDKGKKGKTPPGKRWAKGADYKEIKDYSIDESPKARLHALNKEIQRRGGGHKAAVSTERSLQMVVNLNPNRKSDKVMKGDIKKIKARHP